MADSIPNYLYKYRAVTAQTLSMLAQNKLYLADYRQFNDPFDCQAVSADPGGSLPEVAPGRLRVCALAASPDSVLMWGHYAAAHTGICLRFSPSADEGFRKLCFPVKYSEDFPACGPDCVDDLVAALCTKSIDWKYEQEWRLVVTLDDDAQEQPSVEFEYQPRALTGVIFGLRTSEGDQVLVRRILQDLGHVEYYQIVPDPRRYAIRLRQV